MSTKDYSVTPCTSGHKLEVSAIVDGTAYAKDLIKRKAWANFTCQQQAYGYLGGSVNATRFIADSVPTSASPDPNKLICLIALTKEDDSGYEIVTTANKGALKPAGAFNKYKLCIKGRASDDNPVIIGCDEPHASEAVGAKLTAPFGAPFPGPSIAQQAQAFCRPQVKKYLGNVERSDLVVAENHAGEPNWTKQGNQLYVCFVQTADGKPIKGSLAGIGKKPLQR
ncbi:hypothetical protein G9U51_07945 [Calidifontibacter sp. DB0510]|uniref:Septum formation-related domain-containing protein n=1 Tax=Metallococcus carri TaxID=1656884 RepID=A0A967B6Q1_9MICO|nr:septum formation family protein [Metallococcus carri]NHN55706.1 hypothetical protein [Metallococcus carri]NOP38605.1 hypothetical protein [Calidifontibacter sp. DB2511S]